MTDERQLDDGADLDLSAYDSRCEGCGAIYTTLPDFCQLCGDDNFSPVDGLAW